MKTQPVTLSSDSQSRVPLPKILVVDDHPENLVAMKTVLRSVDAEVITAGSGEDALAQIIRHEFAIILMDVQMPEMDGFETATLIRLHVTAKHTPLIFVTAFDDSEGVRAQGYQVGAVDFLGKPIEPDLLLTKVKVFLDLFAKRIMLEHVLQELQVTQTELHHRNAELSEMNALLKLEIQERTAADQEIQERKVAEVEREVRHNQVVEASRQVGRADVATEVQHHVGNILNSVNVSLGVIRNIVQGTSAEKLLRISTLIQDHLQDLGNFLAHDPKGRNIPEYLEKLWEHLVQEQRTVAKEVQELSSNIEHIVQIIQVQPTLATSGGVEETLSLTELMEQALLINKDFLDRDQIEVIREYEGIPRIVADQHQVLQIVMNLISNATYAVGAQKGLPGRVTLRIGQAEDHEEMVQVQVRDNGSGIKPENLTQIFAQGYSTKKEGHRHELHSAALSAKNMGGLLRVSSDGEGQGATFTLELPLKCREREEKNVAGCSSLVASEEKTCNDPNRPLTLHQQPATSN